MENMVFSVKTNKELGPYVVIKRTDTPIKLEILIYIIGDTLTLNLGLAGDTEPVLRGQIKGEVVHEILNVLQTWLTSESNFKVKHIGVLWRNMYTGSINESIPTGRAVATRGGDGEWTTEVD